MLVRRLEQCDEIAAGDGTSLRELLHPARNPVDIRYSLAIARLEPGTKSQPHRLVQSEVYYLIQGSGVMHIADESCPVRAGDAVYIPPGAIQWLENTAAEPVEFACIVDPGWEPEGEEVLDDK